MEEKLFNFLRFVLGENDYKVEFFPKERLMELIEFIENNEFQLNKMETTEEMMDYAFGTEWRSFMEKRIAEMKKERANIEIKDLNEECIVKPNYLDFNIIDTENKCKDCVLMSSSECHPENCFKKEDNQHHCKYGFSEDYIEYENPCYMCSEGEFNGCPNYMADEEIKPEEEQFFESCFNNKKNERLEDIILKTVDEGSSSSTNKLSIDNEPEVAYTKPMKYYTEENYMKDMEDLIKKKQDKEFEETLEEIENRCGEMNKEYLEDLNKSVEDLINKPAKEYEMVNHPSHYNNSSIETIEKMIRIWGKEQTAMWCEMTAFKYRERIGTKPDNSLEQEMGKILWYENKAHELRATAVGYYPAT